MTETGQQIHGSCVAIDGRGVLLRGPSGAGKSDLALRLIDGEGSTGGLLVADDRVDLRAADGRVIAQPPTALAGRIEVRGLGLLTLPHASEAPLALVVDLSKFVERLPDHRRTAVIGIDVPWMELAPFEASAPAKIRAALGALPWKDLDGDDITQP